MTWEERAEKELSDAKEPITAEATNITKFGAPAAAIFTSVGAVLLGDKWNLDPNNGEVVIAAAVVAAAVMLGVYHAFASDVRARGAVAVERLQSLTALAQEEMRRDAKRAEDADALKEAKAEKQAATEAKVEAQQALAVSRAELAECREARTTAEKLHAATLKADEEERVEARISELQQQLEACRAARDATDQSPPDGSQTVPLATGSSSVLVATLVQDLADAVTEPIMQRIKQIVAESLGSPPSPPSTEAAADPADASAPPSAGQQPSQA